MKKKSILTCICLLTLGLTACRQNTQTAEDIIDDVIYEDTTDTTAAFRGTVIGDGIADTEEDSENKNNSDMQEGPDAQGDPASRQETADVSPDVGSWDGNVYTNQWLNLTFTLPEGWYAATAEEIAQILDLGSNIVASDLAQDQEGLSARISETDTYAFYIYKEDGAAVAFLDLFDCQAAGVPELTAEEYLQQMKAVFEYMESVKAEIEDLGDMSLGGLSGTAMAIRMELPDYGASGKQTYFAAKKDDYIAAVCFSLNLDTAQPSLTELIEGFQPIL